MSDILYECAKYFDESTKYNYIFDIARNNKRIIINMNCIEEEFTHIVGLEHLRDMKMFSTHNSQIKISTFQRILSQEITISDISQSKHFNEIFPNTYNSATKSEYTLSERISILHNIEKVLDNAYMGKIYKWNAANANITMPDGRKRHTHIKADYMLSIPSPQNRDENIYLFFYRGNTLNKNAPIQLYLFSAFADCLDLTSGQERPYTILQEVKENVKTKETEVLYTHPSYEKQQSSQTQLPQQPDNVKQIKFESPTQNVIHNSSGTAAAVLPAPNPFKNFIDRLKNLFKRQDKPAPVPTETEQTEKTDVSETAVIVEKSDVSKEMSTMIEAREAFAAGNLSQEEYQKSVRRYLDTLHGKEEWTKAAEILHKQLDESPDMSRFIGYELKCVEVHIEKHFAPKPTQTLDEIKRFAHEYIKQQNENKSAEKERPAVKDRFER